MNSTSLTLIAPILKNLRHKVVPWAEQWDIPRFSVAYPSYDDLTPAPDVRVTRRTPRGRRVRAKGDRGHGVRLVRWPEDGLETTRFPGMGCVIDGDADIRAGDYILHCGTGQFVFFLANSLQPDGSQPHLEGARRENGSCDIMWFGRWEGGIVCTMCHSKGTLHEPPHLGEECYVANKQVTNYFDMLTEEVLTQSKGREKIYRGLLLSFVVALLREIEEQRFTQTGVAEISSHLQIAVRHDPDPMLRVQEYVRSHLDQPLTIAAAAQLVYMSRSQFTKQFRFTTGKSFVQFVNDERLDKAKTLLRETDWPLDTVSKFAGFKLAHFRSLFRREVGMPPKEYRRRSRERDGTKHQYQ